MREIRAAVHAFEGVAFPEDMPEWYKLANVEQGMRTAIAVYLRLRADGGDVPRTALLRLADQLDPLSPDGGRER